MADFARELKEALATPNGRQKLAERLAAMGIRPEEIVDAFAQAGLLATVVEDRVNRYQVRLRPDDEAMFDWGDAWLLRPVVAGLCQYRDIVDGTLALGDILQLNALLDAREQAPPLAPAKAAHPRGPRAGETNFVARARAELFPALAEERKTAKSDVEAARRLQAKGMRLPGAGSDRAKALAEAWQKAGKPGA